MSQDPHSLPRCGATGPLSTLRLGLAVLGSELWWLATSGLRRFEIRQLTKRMDQEEGILAAASQSDAAFSREQIAFLKDDIAALKDDLAQAREAYVRRRAAAWNLD
jgi:hypothetical protein